MRLTLRPLEPTDEQAAIAAHEQMADWDFLLGWHAQPWADHLATLDDESRGRNLPEGRVPATFLVAVIDGEIVGRLSLRHELNAWLAKYGGHLGYGVLPTHQGRGVATEILRQGLSLARETGLEQVLLTCDDDNLASARVIEKLGGVLQDRCSSADGVVHRRYWIEL